MTSNFELDDAVDILLSMKYYDIQEIIILDKDIKELLKLYYNKTEYIDNLPSYLSTVNIKNIK